MKFSVFLSITLAVLFYGCSKPACFENAGPITSLQRTATPFHRIDLYDNINLVLTQDTTEAIMVQAGQNLQPNITTNIEKGILTIKNTTTCGWLRAPSEKINVFVSVKKLNWLNYNGSGNVTSTNTLQTDTITFYSFDGAGNIDVRLHAKATTADVRNENADIILHGKSEQCFVVANSRGSVDLKDFVVDYLSMGYISVRNTTVHVTRQLDAIIYHTGNIYYKGAPPIVNTTYYSTGKAIALP